MKNKDLFIRRYSGIKRTEYLYYIDTLNGDEVNYFFIVEDDYCIMISKQILNIAVYKEIINKYNRTEINAEYFFIQEAFGKKIKYADFS